MSALDVLVTVAFLALAFVSAQAWHANAAAERRWRALKHRLESLERELKEARR